MSGSIFEQVTELKESFKEQLVYGEFIVDMTGVEKSQASPGPSMLWGLPVREPVVRCRDCAKSRVETHKGDAERVCWKRKSHGEVVPDMGFCHDGVARKDRR